MTTTKTSVDHATHDSGKRNADRVGSAEHAMGSSRNRTAAEDAEDDPQEMDSDAGRAKQDRLRRQPAEG
jgi:hypothetical protein